MSDAERIAVFGDSIAAGAVDPRNGGWVGLLQAEMKRRSPESRVFNFGVSGDDSAALLERFEPQCLASSPTRLIIAIGINDARYAHDSTRADSLRYSLNIERLIAQAAGIAKRSMFVGLTRVDESRTMPISHQPLANFENEMIIGHDAALQSVCRSRGVTYVPMFDVLFDEDLEDGLHPNSRGHQKMFERIRNFL